MHTLATGLQWACLIVGFAVLGAALVSSVRMKLSGASFGNVVEHIENRWFGTGSVLLALLVGTLAMTGAGRLSGHEVGLDEAALIVFPLALVAAFVVRRLTERHGHAAVARASGLVVVPAVLGAVMAAAG